jgi:hypothetical protein
LLPALPSRDTKKETDMSGSTLFFIILVGLLLAMMFMRRGGHSGMGCGMGHGHDQQTPGSDDNEQKTLLGPPGTLSSTPVPVPVPREERKHRGCC